MAGIMASQGVEVSNIQAVSGDISMDLTVDGGMVSAVTLSHAGNNLTLGLGTPVAASSLDFLDSAALRSALMAGNMLGIQNARSSVSGDVSVSLAFAAGINAEMILAQGAVTSAAIVDRSSGLTRQIEISGAAPAAEILTDAAARTVEAIAVLRQPDVASRGDMSQLTSGAGYGAVAMNISANAELWDASGNVNMAALADWSARADQAIRMMDNSEPNSPLGKLSSAFGRESAGMSIAGNTSLRSAVESSMIDKTAVGLWAGRTALWPPMLPWQVLVQP
jgi:hypothetical protein